MCIRDRCNTAPGDNRGIGKMNGAAMTTNEQPCIWQRRAEAMLPLVNAALGIADRCRMSGSRDDFIIVDFPNCREMIKVAEDYRKTAEKEAHQ
jgi:hypothetical protein